MKTGSVRTHVFPFANIIYHVTLLLGVSVNQKREKSRKKILSRAREGVSLYCSFEKNRKKTGESPVFPDRFPKNGKDIWQARTRQRAKGGLMKQPKSVPDNIWDAIEIFAEALRRKFESPLALSADASLSNADATQSSTGGYNGRQKCDTAPAGESEQNEPE